MQLHKLAYSYISLLAGPLACMQIPEIACSSLSLPEVPWAYIKFHGLACSFMSLHAVSWSCMQFLSLSEQLTKILQCLFYWIILIPNVCWVVNLITLLVSEDEGRHRHVRNVLCNPVHLGHHPVNFVKIPTWRWEFIYLGSFNCFSLPAIMTIVHALGTSIPWDSGTSCRPFPVSSLSSLIQTFLWKFMNKEFFDKHNDT